MARFGSIGTQYFDGSGNPLISGKLYFYEPGTDTLKTTYSDVSLSVANTNPVILTAAGRQPNILFNGSARCILTDGDDVQIEVRDPVGGDSVSGYFESWNADQIYNVPAIVQGSDENFYISITDNNVGNDPTSDATNWTQIKFIRFWNTNETYIIADVVQGSDGLLYSSTVNSNVGNNPTTDTVNWKPAATADIPAVIRSAAKTYAYNTF